MGVIDSDVVHGERIGAGRINDTRRAVVEREIAVAEYLARALDRLLIVERRIRVVRIDAIVVDASGIRQDDVSGPLQGDGAVDSQIGVVGADGVELNLAIVLNHANDVNRSAVDKRKGRTARYIDRSCLVSSVKRFGISVGCFDDPAVLGDKLAADDRRIVDVDVRAGAVGDNLSESLPARLLIVAL